MSRKYLFELKKQQNKTLQNVCKTILPRPWYGHVDPRPKRRPAIGQISDDAALRGVRYTSKSVLCLLQKSKKIRHNLLFLDRASKYIFLIIS